MDAGTVPTVVENVKVYRGDIQKDGTGTYINWKEPVPYNLDNWVSGYRYENIFKNR